MVNINKQIDISPIEEIIDEARNGRMYILVDDPKRENEGDLIIPAQMATPDAINFMIKHAKGLVCLPATGDILDRFELKAMVATNKDVLKTSKT